MKLRNAKLIADILLESPLISLDPETVQTNIIIFDLKSAAPDAANVVERAAKIGVSFFDFGPRTIRLVTHRDVSAQQCIDAAHEIVKVVAS